MLAIILWILICIIAFLAWWWLMLKLSRCRFWKVCKWYDSESLVCTETGGTYYDYDRPAGCYRERELIEMAERERKKKIKK